ncbi:MAG TPA: winged helix-turn-helix domain-containing protein [Rudaea sp.]|nr:winged helix-turn-helix domain-containing protein [Rudaea sp.]
MHGNEFDVQQRSWRCGAILVDPLHRRLERDGRPLEIDERAFDLILLLAGRRERAVERREITLALWGTRPVGDNTLRQVVYKARRAVGDDGRRQTIIRTVRGRSLRWVAPITAAPEPRAAARAEEVAAETSARAQLPARWYLPVALALAVLLGSAPWLWSRHAESVRVAILPIDNATGDAGLDWVRDGLPGLISNLLESDGIRVVDPHEVALRSLHATGVRGEDELRGALAAVVVAGRLSRAAGGGYELDLEMRGPARGAVHLSIGGDRPGAVAARAVPQLRDALDRPEKPTHTAAPAHAHAEDDAKNRHADKA